MTTLNDARKAMIAIQRETLNVSEHVHTIADYLDEQIAVAMAEKSALKLQRAFIAQAETREARALHNYASVKVEFSELKERIAGAISRGDLPENFYESIKK